MTIMNYDLLIKKVEQLKGYIGELKELVKLPAKDLLADSLKYHTAERLFQLTVDTCVDINIHIIKEKVKKVPDDLQSTFTVLGEAGILDKDFAGKIAPVVGLRNRIVHRYDSLSRQEFVKTLKEEFPDFEKYKSVITDLVKIM